MVGCIFLIQMKYIYILACLLTYLMLTDYTFAAKTKEEVSKLYEQCTKAEYKYLGIDENISFNGPINKQRVAEEYINRIRKIWNSHLPDFNKVVAYNTFAVPTSIVTILDWTCCKEIDQIGIKTRKTLTMSASFRPNSDTERLPKLSKL